MGTVELGLAIRNVGITMLFGGMGMTVMGVGIAAYEPQLNQLGTLTSVVSLPFMAYNVCALWGLSS